MKTCSFIFTNIMKALQVLASLTLLSLLCPILFAKCSDTLEGCGCIQAKIIQRNKDKPDRWRLQKTEEDDDTWKVTESSALIVKVVVLEAAQCDLTLTFWMASRWWFLWPLALVPPPLPLCYTSPLSDTLCSFVRLDRCPLAPERWQLSDTAVKGTHGCFGHFPEHFLLFSGKVHSTPLPSVIPADSGMEAAATMLLIYLLWQWHQSSSFT